MPEYSPPSTRTKRFSSINESDINQDEWLIIPSVASEERGKLDVWDQFSESNLRNTIVISEIEKDSVFISINGEDPYYLLLTNSVAIESIISAKNILIDISGLPHHVWAPILKSAYETRTITRVLYAEPESYSPHPSPASATLFDLSIQLDGLSPLPGFAQLSGPVDDEQCLFIPLLGFEGNRPQRLLYQIDPTPKVLPVVGVPGFQVEFPAYAVSCNRTLLDEFNAHSDVRFARASCPFETYKILSDIRRDYSCYYFYIAPIGTKPHALGAILYSIANPLDTEVMFDHPVRKPGRTKGVGIIHIYNFGDFNEF